MSLLFPTYHLSHLRTIAGVVAYRKDKFKMETFSTFPSLTFPTSALQDWLLCVQLLDDIKATYEIDESVESMYLKWRRMSAASVSLQGEDDQLTIVGGESKKLMDEMHDRFRDAFLFPFSLFNYWLSNLHHLTTKNRIRTITVHEYANSMLIC